MKNNSNDPNEKVELAKRIADKKKTVKSSYESFEESFFRFFRWLSSLIDHIFFSTKYLGFFALLLSCLAYFVINYENSSNTSTLSSSKTLNNVSVTTRFNSESFEVAGVPTACEVILTGEAANVNNAAARNGYCFLDLEGYTEGSHLVELSAVGYGDNVSYAVTPSNALITLKRKTTMQFDLSYDYINKNQLDSKYILGDASFESGTKINIRASQDTLNSISLVKALIDVSNQTSDFEVEAPLVAYDKNGQAVVADIVPSTVMAKVSISSPHKSVPIILNTIGSLQNNLAINTVSMDHQTTEIYARESVLANVSEVYVDLDLSTLSSDADIMLPVSLPNGVSSSDVTMVNAKISMVEASTRVIENVDIVYRNNDKGYGASNVSATSVNVTVTGAKNNIADIDASNFTVYIDVAGLEPGEYDLPLSVEANNTSKFVNYSLDISDINITLVEVNE